MNGRTVRRISLWLVFVLVILGCASPVFVTPPSSAPVAEPVETIVVQTAAAARTGTAIVLPPTSTATLTPLPTKTVTITPTPTSTVVFLFLTETSLPEGFFDDETETDNEEDASGFQKPEVVREWDCRVTSKSPASGTVIAGGANFRAVWTVENTGTKTWPQKGVDVVYHSGAYLHNLKAYLDIPATIKPGGRVTITIPMTAPKLAETYSTRWSLRVGKKDFCLVKFSIKVK
jgi:hypothetical protein